MAETQKKNVPDNYGILTDEGIDKLRERIGIQVNKPTPPHNYEVTWDGTRHFAVGYGDDNPLWCDKHYGDKTRWGGLIAPPNFLYTMGVSDAPPITPEVKAMMKGDPLAGLGSYQAQMEFEWWRPLRLGDQLKQRFALIGVQVNDKSGFAGRTVSEVNGYIYRNQDDELHAIQRGTWIRAERHASKEKKKEYDLPTPYTDAQLAEIDACYAAEKLRGAETRYWEDVIEGEDMQTIVRGPLRTSDLVVWHVGWGMQLTPPGAFRQSWKIRAKVPGLYTPNELNVPDTVQRLHWEKAWANELGIPIPYDYGGLRETFLTNTVTNWMGDDGWLWKLSCQHRKFVYTGDTYWIKGKVRKKVQEEGRNEVHLDIWVENQHGTVVSPGNAVVLLPTRDAPVELPKPAKENIDEMYAYEVERLKQ
ncbi:MaoC family dehydratase N-terminal domain-containing protein [Sphingopyxis sp. OPL5]|uniref:FAS1-like dehydratase domain-containing protein n=1 Tax=Sphingopyxis sp. OPL5 TaxID=2486273 RepID=UPI0008B8BA36|nr:MaoC family dehydratase N-terminal domain-containing protein [Sphingopyxis sp. OPL5]OHD01484.1 MAG: acyl dehydratase [Sphingopyxis sp. RIFCSPHIGHO2_01_FULL_65_24]QNO28828.1 MaoC family dehydratase N-terminal domain-containing protein [Sphingopyxis sp. OPL5]